MSLRSGWPMEFRDCEFLCALAKARAKKKNEGVAMLAQASSSQTHIASAVGQVSFLFLVCTTKMPRRGWHVSEECSLARDLEGSTSTRSEVATSTGDSPTAAFPGPRRRAGMSQIFVNSHDRQSNTIVYLLKNFRLFKVWFLVELVTRYGRSWKLHFHIFFFGTQRLLHSASST